MRYLPIDVRFHYGPREDVSCYFEVPPDIEGGGADECRRNCRGVDFGREPRLVGLWRRDRGGDWCCCFEGLRGRLVSRSLPC